MVADVWTDVVGDCQVIVAEPWVKVTNLCSLLENTTSCWQVIAVVGQTAVRVAEVEPEAKLEVVSVRV